MWPFHTATVNASPSFDPMEGSMTASTLLAIETLIVERCKVLRLSRTDLVRRAGFKNVAKGLRRLDELCAGEMKTTVSLIAGLPAALELPPDVITDTMRQTK